MSAQGSKSEVVLALAEEFLGRYRQGERPSLKEYAERHPELAAEIRQVFPAMALMENIALADESLEGEAAGQAPPPPAPLQQLGDFRIIREVGRGGMGIVYEAEQVSLGRHVALKVLSRRMLLDARQARRFEREARAAARLHHTNIVPVFGVGRHDGLPYYVMQLIQGRGLHEVIEELRRLQHPQQPATLPEAPRQVGDPPHPDVSAADAARSLLTGDFQRPDGAMADDAPGAADPAAASPESRPSETCALSSSSVVLPGQSGDSHKGRGKKPTYWQSVAQIGVQVAGALEHAHGQGILHRDIKPSNLLLDLRGSVWVTDFGLAKADDQQDLTHTGDVLGTLRYMPPEAFEGRTDRRGDIYSLGLTLYELLALRPAFVEKDRHRLIKRVTSEEPERLERLNPQVPRDLVTIVHKAMDRDVHHRYASAADLAADLERFLDDEPIHARRISLVERLLRWARRNKGIAASLSAVALLLVLLAAGALLTASFRRREQEQRLLAEEKEKERGWAEQARTLAEEAQQRESDLLALAERRGQELHRNLYFAEMNHAGQAAELPSGISRVGELLAPWRRSEPDLRRWEWYYLHGLCHRELLTLRGHGHGVISVAWSPDGRRLASASDDQTVKVWEVATGKEILTLRGHTDRVESVAWSPDGTRLASASWDATVKVWEATTGKDTLTLRGHTNQVWSVAWSPDGTRLASASQDRTVKVWEAASGKETLTLRGHTNDVLSVAWGPDGTRLASGSWDGTAKVWDTATGRKTLTLRGHTKEVWSVAWSPDGTRLASASADTTVKVWNAATGKDTLTLRGHTNRVLPVAWSPDGTRLASASWDQTVRIWSAATRKEMVTLRGHSDEVNAVAWSADGTRLASASDDRTVKVWDAAAGKETLALRGHASWVRAAWSPDGTWLASASGDNTVKVWEAATGKVLRTLRGHPDWVEQVAWSPDSKRLASASADQTAKVWDAVTGRETLTLRGHREGLMSVAWSPDGTRLASASKDGTAKIWDAASGKETFILRGHNGWVRSVAWSPDGTRLASAGDDRTVRIWDAVSGKEALTLRGHISEVWWVAWNPNGTRLVSGSWDNTAKVWEVATGKEILTLRGHSQGVLSVAWSPDGTRLASASQDRTVKVWDAASGKETLTLRGQHTDRVIWVAWSPDGTRLASASDDHTILVYDATIGYVLERSPQLLPMLERRLAADPRTLKNRQLRVEIQARLGDWGPAAADIQHYVALSPDHPRWYATDWWVVGRYPEDLKATYAPENDPDPSQPVPAAAAQAGATPPRLPWQVVPRDANGFVDFGALFDRAEHISAYALMRVYSPARQRVAILLGSDDGVRLWLNGQLVHENPAWRKAVPDDDAVPASLEAGWNTLLAKVANVTHEHALYLRLSAEPAELAWASITALIESGQRDEAERALIEALAKQPDHAPTRALAERFFPGRADADAHRGEWTRVASDYAQLLKLRPNDHWLWYRAIAVHAHLGNQEEYRRLCRGMLECFGTTDDPNIAERIAKSCLLLAGGSEGRKKLAKLIDLALAQKPDRPDMPWFLTVRGLAEYRAGRWADAAGWLEKSLANQPPVYVQAQARFLLAMTQQQRGQTEAAKATLARALEITARQMPTLDKSGGDWHDWLINDLLRREAEALLAGSAPESKK
jgi:WD40 repeat protein/serine/threonine protein kinase/tetratricopeptide (TPR) repeat protein